MSGSRNFQGIYTALITPMTSKHELNEEAFREVVEFNIRSGINGFWVAGGSGESVLLEDDENSRMAKIVTDQADGRAKIIMHVGAPTTKRAAKMAENAAKAGVDAICCVPPFFYGQSDEAIARHYRAVADAAGAPAQAARPPARRSRQADLLSTPAKHSGTATTPRRPSPRSPITCHRRRCGRGTPSASGRTSRPATPAPTSSA